MQVFKSIMGATALTLALTACNSVDFKKTSAGVPYKIIGSSKGDSIAVGHIVKFHLIQKTKDTVLGNSYKDGAPQYMQIQAMTTRPEYADLAANMMETFRKAHKGDSLHMVFSADSILKKFPDLAKSAPVKKGDEIMVSMRILDVYKTEDEARAASNKDRIANSAAREKQAIEGLKKDTAFQNSIAKDNQVIEAYLASKNLQAQKTDLGVYVQTLQAGAGSKPQPGQYASIKYKGMDLNGKVFDQGTFPMQIGMGGSIPGFENGVKQFAKGGKGNIYIPSILGYGPQGSPPRIQPNQILVFEIEMLDISDSPIAQAPMPAPEGHSKDDGHGH